MTWDPLVQGGSFWFGTGLERSGGNDLRVVRIGLHVVRRG
jgi:hypothetical protein